MTNAQVYQALRDRMVVMAYQDNNAVGRVQDTAAIGGACAAVRVNGLWYGHDILAYQVQN